MVSAKYKKELWLIFIILYHMSASKAKPVPNNIKKGNTNNKN